MNIFVGNLAWTTTEEDLAQLFEPFGTVEQARIATDRDTGLSRGFGFVEMPDDTEAQAAIDELNGSSIWCRTTDREMRHAPERSDAREGRGWTTPTVVSART